MPLASFGQRDMKYVLIAAALAFTSPVLAQTMTDPANMELNHTHGNSALDTQVADILTRLGALEAMLSSLSGAFNSHVLDYQAQVDAGAAERIRMQMALDLMKCALDPTLPVCL